MKIHGNLDFSNNAVRNMVLSMGTALPANPPIGTPFFLEGCPNSGLYVYTSSGWRNTSDAIVSDGPPNYAPTQIGQLHVNALNGTVLVSKHTASISGWKELIGPSLNSGMPSYIHPESQKQVSVANNLYVFSLNTSTARDLYLNTSCGISSSVVGYVMLHNAIITKVLLQQSSDTGASFELHLNGSHNAYASWGFPEGQRFTYHNTSVELQEYDELAIYVNSHGHNKIANPVCTLEIAWRD